MGSSEWTMVVVFLMTIIFGVIGWLLANKDRAQADAIATLKKETDESVLILFAKHDADVERLNELQRELDKNFTPTIRVESMFTTLQASVKSDFVELGDRLTKEIDKLNDTLVRHIDGHHGQ